MSSFPATRLRRLRRTPALRALARENRLDPARLVQPMFVTAGEGKREPIAAMPGVERVSINEAVSDAAAVREAGVGAVLLFGIPQGKDEVGSEAYDDEGVVQLATRAIKEAQPDLAVITDVCLCAYTDHGHCGILRSNGSGEVDNDITIELLAKTAISHADAGADVVAPSAMMDGQVAAIRHQLGEEGHPETAILSYCSKYASAFYGPFREAADSAPGEGDRRGYQMDPANSEEAIREARLDLDEGADMLMVKPGMPCLDVVRAVKRATEAPLAAYQVSGEYSMIKAADQAGWLDEREAALEALTALHRAGADIVVTYFATKVKDWME